MDDFAIQKVIISFNAICRKNARNQNEMKPWKSEWRSGFSGTTKRKQTFIVLLNGLLLQLQYFTVNIQAYVATELTFSPNKIIPWIIWSLYLWIYYHVYIISYWLNRQIVAMYRNTTCCILAGAQWRQWVTRCYFVVNTLKPVLFKYGSVWNCTVNLYIHKQILKSW